MIGITTKQIELREDGNMTSLQTLTNLPTATLLEEC